MYERQKHARLLFGHFKHEQLQALEEKHFREQIVPGEWFCPVCSFRLHSQVLNAADGSVGVDASTEAEQCPNNCGTLAPLTWKQDAADANRVALALMKELHTARKRLEELDTVH